MSFWIQDHPKVQAYQSSWSHHSASASSSIHHPEQQSPISFRFISSTSRFFILFISPSLESIKLNQQTQWNSLPFSWESLSSCNDYPLFVWIPICLPPPWSCLSSCQASQPTNQSLNPLRRLICLWGPSNPALAWTLQNYTCLLTSVLDTADEIGCNGKCVQG